jgi:hypothetical protein
VVSNILNVYNPKVKRKMATGTKKKKAAPKKKAAKKNEVATAGQFTQNDVPAMLEQIKSKIAELVGSGKKEPSTKGKHLPGFGEIVTIEKEADLIKAYSSVTGREDSYNAAAKAMKIRTKVPPFVIDGISASKWKEDITARFAEVAHKAQLDKLKSIQKTLEENLSAEAKLNNDLAKISTLMAE